MLTTQLFRIILLLFLVTFVSDCATRGPYWVNERPPGLVSQVIELENPQSMCQQPALGCYVPQYGIIVIQKGLPPQTRLCVLRHEYRHAAGDTHPEFNEPGYGIDCGTGEIIP